MWRSISMYHIPGLYESTEIIEVTLFHVQEKRQLMAKMKRLERDNARQAADLARREALEAVRTHDI